MLRMVENGTPESVESLWTSMRSSFLSSALISDPEGIDDFIESGSCPTGPNLVKPNSDEWPTYSAEVAADPRKTLWENLEALMERRWAGVNKSRLARDAEIGTTTLKRVVNSDDSVGLDVIRRLAGVFGVPVWRLLKPGDDFPEQQASERAREIARLFDRLPAPRQARAYALIVQLLEFSTEGSRESDSPAEGSRESSPAAAPSPEPAPAGRKPPVRARR